jgi:hypothetical protein
VTTVTATGHNITVGQTVRVSNVDATVNGTYVVTAVATNTISFTNMGTNGSGTGLTGTVLAIVAETITCAVNEIPAEGTFTITAVGGIS